MSLTGPHYKALLQIQYSTFSEKVNQFCQIKNMEYVTGSKTYKLRAPVAESYSISPTTTPPAFTPSPWPEITSTHLVMRR